MIEYNLKSLRNKKGDLYSVLFFGMAIVFFSLIAYFIYSISSPPTAPIRKIDFEATAAVIPEALVNSPRCLLYTETVEVSGQKKISFDRNVIDWDRVNDDFEHCIWPGSDVYTWRAEVKNLETGDSVSFGTDPPSDDCSPKMFYRSILIKDGNEIYPGELILEVNSVDFEGNFVVKEGKNHFAITNRGSCTSSYYGSIDCKDSSWNLVSGGGLSIEVSNVKPGDTKNTSSFDCPDDAMYAKAAVNPDIIFWKYYYLKL